MGGSAALITTVFSTVMSAMAQSKSDSSSGLEEERRAQAEEERQKEADERRRDREKVLEARELEEKDSKSTLSSGSASLVDEPEVSTKTLKSKLGE